MKSFVLHTSDLVTNCLANTSNAPLPENTSKLQSPPTYTSKQNICDREQKSEMNTGSKPVINFPAVGL